MTNRAIRATVGQFRLFMPEQLLRQPGVVVRMNEDKTRTGTAPLTEMETAAVRCLRNLILDKAQLYCERMRK
jgi:hypothetical protein